MTRSRRRRGGGAAPGSTHGLLADLTPRTRAQHAYLTSLRHNTLTLGVGPAGTGKSWIAIGHACQLLAAGQLKRVLVSRPVVEAGESLGFLPGGLEDKIDPYFAPMRAIMHQFLGVEVVRKLVREEAIVVKPLAFMRGWTFDDCLVVLDEAQNTTPAQVKLLLTRIGERAQVVINGDVEQMDITGDSGLQDALDRFEGRESVGVVRFREGDVVRSGFARMAVDAYRGTGGTGVALSVLGFMRASADA